MSTGAMEPRPGVAGEAPEARSVIRDMREADIPEVAAIERRAYPFPWPAEAFRVCLDQGFVCRLLEGGKEIQGYGLMQVGAARAHILNLCVRPELQRQGLGTRLLIDLLRQARRLRAEVVVLEVRVSNRAARNLYKRMGFTRLAIARGYYPAERGREDALVLGRAL